MIMDGNDPDGTAPDTDDYTAEIEALLDDPDTDDVPGVDDDNEADEADGQEPEAPSEDDDDTPSPDDESEAGDPEAQAPDLSDVELFLSNGQKVNRKQIEAAFQAERDIRAAFTPKFQELAEGRKALEAEKQGLSQQIEYFDQIVPYAHEVLQQVLPQPATEEEHQRDPLAAQAKDRAYQRGQQQFGAIQQAIEYRQQEAAREQQEAIFDRKQRMAQALFERRTELRDRTKFAEYEGQLKQTLASYGFHPEDVKDIADPRMLQVFEDAQAYRALKAAKPKAQQKAAGAPPVAAPGPRKGANGAKGKQRDDLKSRLRSSGDERFADALLRDLID